MFLEPFLRLPRPPIPCLWTACLAAVSCVFSLAAQEKTYIGAKTCATCHQAQWVSQSTGSHARTLYPISEHPLAAFFVPSKPLRREPNFTLKFSRSGQEIRVRAFDDSRPAIQALELPVEWAVGAGDNGVTFVTRLTQNHKKAIAAHIPGAINPVSGAVNPRFERSDYFLEHAFSYYSDTGSFDITPGHESRVEVLPEALGLPIGGSEKENCFPCHSTGPLSRSPQGGLQPSELGVRCEVCHGPGSAHMEAIVQGELERARTLIDNPGRLSPEELNQLCGTCHRTGEQWTEGEWDRAFNVRHQPPYLRRSQCFQKSNGALSCLTCHDLHEGVRRNQPTYYSQRCAACHNAGNNPPMSVCEEQQPADCVSCHMPVVFASSHMPFRNHWIGVYQEGSSPRPSR